MISLINCQFIKLAARARDFLKMINNLETLTSQTTRLYVLELYPYTLQPRLGSRSKRAPFPRHAHWQSFFARRGSIDFARCIIDNTGVGCPPCNENAGDHFSRRHADATLPLTTHLRDPVVARRLIWVRSQTEHANELHVLGSAATFGLHLGLFHAQMS